MRNPLIVIAISSGLLIAAPAAINAQDAGPSESTYDGYRNAQQHRQAIERHRDAHDEHRANKRINQDPHHREVHLPNEAVEPELVEASIEELGEPVEGAIEEKGESAETEEKEVKETD